MIFSALHSSQHISGTNTHFKVIWEKTHATLALENGSFSVHLDDILGNGATMNKE